MADEAQARRARARRLRKTIGDLKKGQLVAPAQQPGESDAEYVHRRMRAISKKPKRRAP